MDSSSTTKPPRSTVSWQKSPIVWLLAIRVANALLVKTFFQPDEYYQSLEPAWHIAFGEGSGAWITWVSSPVFYVASLAFYLL